MADVALHPVVAQLSASQLTFDPDGAPVSFTVAVDNLSSDFASFQLQLLAAGFSQAPGLDWYRLQPAVSSKIPAGDRTEFWVEIFGLPPQAQGFTGKMSIIVRIFSPELGEEDRQDLRLTVVGSGLLPPEISLSETQVQRFPGDRLEIQATLKNPNRKSLTSQVTVRGLELSWLPAGAEKSITLAPAEEKTVMFTCEIPEPTLTSAGRYSIQVRASHPQARTVSAEMLLQLLEKGNVIFGAVPREQQIPAQAYRWLNPLQATATYELNFDNQSNANLIGEVEVHSQRSRWPWLKHEQRIDKSEVETDSENFFDSSPDKGDSPDEDVLEGEAVQVDLPIAETTPIPLTVTRKLPWLGWPRIERLEAKAQLLDSNLDLRNDVQTLELQLLPVISMRLQLLLLLLIALLGSGLFGLIGHRGHWAAVNTVQFNGLGTEVISASDDQTIRRWRVDGKTISPKGILTRFNKAVRAAHYRPVDNNAVVAALENGDIQKLDLLSGRFLPLLGEPDDRVFDAIFSRDARTLYSGHGSGKIWRWSLEGQQNLSVTRSQSPELLAQTDFAIDSLALTGSNEDYLAIAGRYNQLQLLSLTSSSEAPLRQVTLAYPSGGKDAYITSLATAADNPNLLAAADNQGKVVLWNVDDCLSNDGQCGPSDQWQAHGGQPVNAVALSANGCFLTSAGDDNRVRLWPLNRRGKRQQLSQEPGGQVLSRSKQRMNAVAIIQQRDRLAVVSGSDDNRVRLKTLRLRDQRDGSDCSTLR